jgi:hypothetical protein
VPELSVDVRGDPNTTEETFPFRFGDRIKVQSLTIGHDDMVQQVRTQMRTPCEPAEELDGPPLW